MPSCDCFAKDFPSSKRSVLLSSLTLPYDPGTPTGEKGEQERRNTMAITISPMTPGFAAEIGDVDLSQPLTPSEVNTIKQAFWDYAVLIFPEQPLSEEEHLSFARCFGPLGTNP